MAIKTMLQEILGPIKVIRTGTKVRHQQINATELIYNNYLVTTGYVAHLLAFLNLMDHARVENNLSIYNFYH